MKVKVKVTKVKVRDFFFAHPCPGHPVKLLISLFLVIQFWAPTQNECDFEIDPRSTGFVKLIISQNGIDPDYEEFSADSQSGL
jgi:hypothetical protein